MTTAIVASGWKLYREIFSWQVGDITRPNLSWKEIGKKLLSESIDWVRKFGGHSSNIQVVNFLNRINILQRLMKLDGNIITIEEARVAIHAILEPEKHNFKKEGILLVSPSIGGNIIVRIKE